MHKKQFGSQAAECLTLPDDNECYI